METDKNPTFAEALLALAVKGSAGCSDSEAIETARAQIASAPPEIRRALWGDIPGGNSDRVRGCEDTLNRHAQWITQNEVAISELKKAAMGVDKRPDTEFDGLPIGHMISMLSDAKAGRPVSKADADAMGGWLNSRALGVKGDKREPSRPVCTACGRYYSGRPGAAWHSCDDSLRGAADALAAAVACAEKAEEQMRHDGEARQMAEAGRSSAVEAMCTIERERDALRAELASLERKAKADVMEANLRARTAKDERDTLRAELDKANVELADVEKAVSAYPMIGPVSARVFQIVASREFQVCLAVKAGNERDALAAKLREAEDAAQSYWLIELSPSCYLTAAGCLIPKFTWTAEYDSALKFQSKTEADQVLTAIRNLVPSLFPENLPTCARPTEHAWIAARKALDAKEQP